MSMRDECSRLAYNDFLSRIKVCASILKLTIDGKIQWSPTYVNSNDKRPKKILKCITTTINNRTIYIRNIDRCSIDIYI